MRNSYFNTTNESVDLVKYESKAETQEEEVLELFRENKQMTASEAHKHFDKNVPITSIRRAITVLARKGKVIKTNDKKEGIYGRPESVYAVIGKYYEPTLF